MNISNLYKRVNVSMGKNCQVSDFCSLENVVLGDNVVIADGVQLKNVVIGDNAKLGRNITLYSDKESQPVRIGRYCWLSYGVFGEATQGEIILKDYAIVAHRAILLSSTGTNTNNPVMYEIYPEHGGPITIGKYAWIGAQCTILPDVILGDGVVIGANSLVKGGRYEAWSVYGGTPAKLLKKIDPAAVERAKAKIEEERRLQYWELN